MPEPVHPHLVLVAFAVAAVGFALFPLGLAALWRRRFAPTRPGREKNATYECGLAPSSGTSVPIRSDYHVYAIVFLVFDVEAVFLIPAATAFAGMSAGACVALLAFVLLLAEGLAWAWMKGVLEWK